MAQILDSEIGSSVRTKLNNTGLRRNRFGAGSAPTTNDDANDGYELGSLWVDSIGAWVLTDPAVGNAVWEDLVASGGGGLDSAATVTLVQPLIDSAIAAIPSGGAITGTSLNLEHTSPSIRFEDTNSPADNGVWNIMTQGQTLVMDVTNDLGNSGTTFHTITRDDNAITSIEWGMGSGFNTITFDSTGGATFTGNILAPNLPNVSQERITRSAAFTLADSDMTDGTRMYIMTGLADSAEITVPSGLSGNEYCTIVNRTNQRVSFAPAGGVDLVSYQDKYALLGRGASAVIMRDSTNAYFLFGQLDS